MFGLFASSIDMLRPNGTSTVSSRGVPFRNVSFCLSPPKNTISFASGLRPHSFSSAASGVPVHLLL
jgi:hypothetical protein